MRASLQLRRKRGCQEEIGRSPAGALRDSICPALFHVCLGSLMWAGTSLTSLAVPHPPLVLLTHYLSSMRASPLPAPAIGLHPHPPWAVSWSRVLQKRLHYNLVLLGESFPALGSTRSWQPFMLPGRASLGVEFAASSTQRALPVIVLLSLPKPCL